MFDSRETLGLLFGFIGVAIFAGTLPATRIGVVSLDPAFLTAARVVLAGLCAAAYLLALRRPFPPRAAFWPIVVVAFCVGLGFPFFMAVAMQTVPAAHGGVVLGAMPLVTALLAVLMTHERPGAGFWLAAFAGAALVVIFALRNGGSGALAYGDGLLVLAIIFSSLGYVVSSKLTLQMSGLEVISWALVVALPFALPLSLWLLPPDLNGISFSAWASLLYLAFFSQWLGFYFWNTGLAMGGVARVSQVQLLQVFITVAMAAVLNREVIDIETLVFAAGVVAAVAVGTRVRIKRD